MKRLFAVISWLLAFALAGCGGGGGSPPPPPTIVSIVGLPASDRLTAATAYALSVTETMGGQAVTPGTVTFTLSSAATGAISGSTLTTGDLNASGTLTATDSTHGSSATVSIAVGSTFPATSGDTASYAGTLVKHITRPLPDPTATQPPYTYTYAVAITSKTATAQTFNGMTGLNEYATIETDTGSTPPLPVTTTDTFFAFVPASAGATDVVSYGSSASDTNGSTYRTELDAASGLLDILPETSGRAWQNTAAETYSEAEPDSTTIARTVAAAGSYSETDTYAGGTKAVITVNADLSGSYTNPAYGITSLTFSAPVGVGSAKTITVTDDGDVASIPDWYPATSLHTDAATLATAQPIPAACNVPAAVGTSANVIVEKSTRLDPVLGTFETRTDDTYLAPFYGTVCTRLADTLDDYYDYSGQVDDILSTVPQQITTLAETIGFAGGTIAGATASARTAGLHSQAIRPQSSAGASLNRVAMALGRASFDRAVERLYRDRRMALRTFMRNHTSLKWTGR